MHCWWWPLNACCRNLQLREYLALFYFLSYVCPFIFSIMFHLNKLEQSCDTSLEQKFQNEFYVFYFFGQTLIQNSKQNVNQRFKSTAVFTFMFLRNMIGFCMRCNDFKKLYLVSFLVSRVSLLLWSRCARLPFELCIRPIKIVHKAVA